MGADPSQGPRRVLVCDDEPMVREIVEATLRSAGFEPVCAADAARALEQFGASPHSFEALIVDRRLGAESGVALIERLRTLRVDTPVLLVSGVHERPVELERIPGPAIALLPKPFRPSALLAALRALLAES